MDGAAVAAAPNGGGLHPIGAVHGRVLFEKILLVHALGVTLHRQRTARQMGHEHGRDAGVVIHHLAFGEAGGWIEDFFEVG